MKRLRKYEKQFRDMCYPDFPNDYKFSGKVYEQQFQGFVLGLKTAMTQCQKLYKVQDTTEDAMAIQSCIDRLRCPGTWKKVPIREPMLLSGADEVETAAENAALEYKLVQISVLMEMFRKGVEFQKEGDDK